MLLFYTLQGVYFYRGDSLVEADGTSPITLNNFIRNQISSLIQEIPLVENTFTLGEEGNEQTFEVRIFKIYSPKNQKSKISLVADRREVTETPIHSYVPEFIDEFYDDFGNESEGRDRNYIIKAYVFGPYLDSNVSLERGGFEFQKDNDLLLGISQSEIESAAAEIARHTLGSTISARQDKKRKHVWEYIESSAPWHRTIAEDIDLSSMPYNPTPEQIETTFQKEKFNQEVAIRRDMVTILSDNNTNNIANGVSEILTRISKTSQNDLIHYIALRRSVLDIFSRSLELNEEGKYSSEGTVHDIIFPRKGDSSRTSFENHNLWIIDERLNFTNFVSSDTPLDGSNSDRPDLLVYNTPVLFRGDNEPSNPLTIFEFKKPQRDDFANPSSRDDPIQQIVRYVNQIREGKYKTPKGREILVAQNTPVYGYVICDINQKVDKWLHQEKDFSPMPDRRGWFKWFSNNNLYMEVLSWDKVLRDATMRNKIFFHTLGID